MRIGIDFDDTIVNTKEIVRKFMDRYNVENFKDEEEKTVFYKKYIEEITKQLTLKLGVVESLNRLKRDNELFLITARGTYYSSNLPKLTLEYIKKNKIPVEEIYFDCIIKVDKCLELGIDLFIDDLVSNCLPVREFGIRTLLFDNEYEGLETVRNWQEVEKVVE